LTLIKVSSICFSDRIWLVDTES